MRSHDFRLLACGCCAWVVIAGVLACGGGADRFLVVAACCSVVVALGLWRGGALGLVGALAGAVTLTLAVTSAGHEFRSERGPVRELAQGHAIVAADVVVTKEPVTVSSSKPGRPPVVLMAGRVVSITGRGMTVRVDTPVVILGHEQYAALHWRARVHLVGQLRPAQGPGPARAMLMARGAPRAVREPPQPLRAFEGLRERLRSSVEHAPADARGLTPALVDGDVSRLPEDLKDTMNAVGMSHLNAVSGSNVTIVLVAFLWLCGLVRLGRRGRLVGGGLCLIGFVMLCHPDPSVIRAAAMGVVGLVGTSAGRPRAACPALGAAIVVLLGWDPWLALSPGFALSALATAGLVLFARPWTAAAMRVLPAWCAKPCELTMIPIAAQAPCLPVLVALNNSVSLVSVPANVAAEPLVAPATLGGMGLLLLFPLPAPIRHLLAWPVAWPAWLIARIARIAAAMPGGALPWPAGWWGAVTAIAVILVPLFCWRVARYAGRWGIVCVTVAAALVAALVWPTPGGHRVPPTWRYAMCDVGQGDAGILATGEVGHAVVVDVGPEESGGITRCLHRHGVTRIDAVILSHFHADHVGALPRVLDEFQVGDVFVTPVREDADGTGHGERGAGPEVDEALRRRGRTPTPLGPGSVVRIGSLVIDVLWPKRVLHEGSVQNNASLILDVQSPDLHMLFLGDAEKEADAAVQSEVARRGAQRSFDVVKVGHHGSGNQLPTLYTAAQARYGAIGVGKDNDYGHPSKKLLRMLEGSHTTPCRTDELGDITFFMSDAGVSTTSERSAC